MAKLFSRALQLFASEGAGEWSCTAIAIDCPTSSAADELLIMLIQDCLSLGKEVKLLDAFIVLSREEKEHDVSFDFREDEDACCAYFA